MSSQRSIDAVFNSKPGVTSIVHDMIITGKFEEKHNCNFLIFLQITTSNHLGLNGENLPFKLKEVLFFGHRWSRDGLGPDRKKIKSIFQKKMPEKKETRKNFLGIQNFLGRFSSKISELSVSLRKISNVTNSTSSTMFPGYPDNLG